MTAAPNKPHRPITSDPDWIRWTLIGLGLSFMFVFLLLPLIEVFTEALRKGLDAYFAAVMEPDAVSAIRLTLLVAAIAVPANLVFGISAAWSITKFNFRGKN